MLLLSLCLLIPVWIVYLLLLGQLSPKHKRSSKQVNDGMFLPLVSSYLHDCDAPPFISHDEGLVLSSHTSYLTFCVVCYYINSKKKWRTYRLAYCTNNSSFFCLECLLLCTNDGSFLVKNVIRHAGGISWKLPVAHVKKSSVLTLLSVFSCYMESLALITIPLRNCSIFPQWVLETQCAHYRWIHNGWWRLVPAWRISIWPFDEPLLSNNALHRIVLKCLKATWSIHQKSYLMHLCIWKAPLPLHPQAYFTAHQTPWPSPGSGPNWAVSGATAQHIPTKSQTWIWAARWASMLSLTTWSVSSAGM